MNIGSVLVSLRQKFRFLSAIGKGGVHCHTDAKDESDRLLQELSEMEYTFGKHLVWLNRYPVKSRLKTIARNHVRNAVSKTETEWVCEARAIARYIGRKPEHDAEVALTMLMPFESQYRRARDEQISGKRGSKPTVGQVGGFEI